MLVAERTSVLKRRGQGTHGQFQSMYIAVYPQEIQFLKTVEHMSAFYFQKKFQIIGRVASCVPPCSKGSKYLLNSMDDIIQFRMFSQKSMTYQWSVYKVHIGGQEQFYDSCTINLKDEVNNFIFPRESSNTRTSESILKFSNNEKKVKLHFDKLGINLLMSLHVADDPESIVRDIERKYFSTNEKRNDLFDSTSNMKYLQTDFNEGLIQLSSRKQKSFESKSGKLSNKGSFGNQPSHQFDNRFENKQKLISESIKNTSSFLDRMILGNEAELVRQSQNNLEDKKEFNQEEYVVDDEFNQIKLKIQAAKRLEKTETQMEKVQADEKDDFNEHQADSQSRLCVKQERDYGILKLQSDNIKKEEIDNRLQLEQLAVIEEEKRSNVETAIIFPRFKNFTYNKNRKPNDDDTAKLDNQATNDKIKQKSIKKYVITCVGLIFLLIFSATLLKNSKIKIKKHKNR